jgi:hypothetical protein
MLRREILPGQVAYYLKAVEPERHVGAAGVLAFDFALAQVRDGLDEGKLPAGASTSSVSSRSLIAVSLSRVSMACSAAGSGGDTCAVGAAARGVMRPLGRRAPRRPVRTQRGGAVAPAQGVPAPRHA